MDPATIVIIAIIVVATLGIWLLPKRKRWNDDGAADEARKQALARDLEQDFPGPGESADDAKERTARNNRIWPHGKDRQ